MAEKENNSRQLGLRFDAPAEVTAHAGATLSLSSSWPRTPAFHAGNPDSNSGRDAKPLPEFYAELVERIRARLVADPERAGCLVFPQKPGRHTRIKHEGKLYSPHRVMLEWKLQRVLPRRLDACHECDNPPCCAERHLWAGTRSANNQDAIRKGRMRPPVRGPGPRERCANCGRFGKSCTVCAPAPLSLPEQQRGGRGC